MVGDRDLIFHMCIPRGKIFPLVTRPRSFVEVKVKNQIFFKNCHYGGINVSQTQLFQMTWLVYQQNEYYGFIFIFQLREYPCNIAHDISFLIYNGYFFNKN